MVQSALGKPCLPVPQTIDRECFVIFEQRLRDLAKDRTTGRGTGPTVYVTSQGLFYDSIVLADLPSNGRFQQLQPGEGDAFFLCPLLGPGRTVL